MIYCKAAAIGHHNKQLDSFKDIQLFYRQLSVKSKHNVPLYVYQKLFLHAGLLRPLNVSYKQSLMDGLTHQTDASFITQWTFLGRNIIYVAVAQALACETNSICFVRATKSTKGLRERTDRAGAEFHPRWIFRKSKSFQWDLAANLRKSWTETGGHFECAPVVLWVSVSIFSLCECNSCISKRLQWTAWNLSLD